MYSRSKFSEKASTRSNYNLNLKKNILNTLLKKYKPKGLYKIETMSNKKAGG